MPSVHFACFIRSVRCVGSGVPCAHEPDARSARRAIKLFRLTCLPERVHQLVAEFEQLIARRARPSRRLRRPLAAGIDGVTAYLAQDYVTAESLDVVIREGGPPPVADALEHRFPAGGGSDYAAGPPDRHGVAAPARCPASPENFRARWAWASRARSNVVGVPAPVRRPYTAPERIGGGAWDRRADIFSLAAIACELVGPAPVRHRRPGRRGHHRRAAAATCRPCTMCWRGARRRHGGSVRHRVGIFRRARGSFRGQACEGEPHGPAEHGVAGRPPSPGCRSTKRGLRS